MSVMQIDTEATASSSRAWDAHPEPGENLWTPRQAASTMLTAGMWLALATGWAESVYWLIKRELLSDLVFMHPGHFWMAPIAQLVLFAGPAGVLTLLAWRRPGSQMLVFGVTALSLVGWLNVLLLIPGLQFWAWIVAAGGLATASGRVYRKHASRCLQCMRLSLPAMVAPLLMLPFVQQAASDCREKRAVAALPTPPENAPNVLLIVLDTTRADFLELYGGDEVVAPNLAALAAEGVTFEQAWSTAPWTLPSQAGMFTGCVPHEITPDWLSALDDSRPTLAAALAERGWLTGGFVGNTRYCSAETGLARGFTHYEDYSISPGNFALCASLSRLWLTGTMPLKLGMRDWPGRKTADDVSGGLLRWLERRPERPYFAFLNYFDAHDPYIPPPEFEKQPSNTPADRLLNRNFWWADKQTLSEEQVAKLRQAYIDCLRGLDDHIGRMLAELRRRGDLDNTIIVVTADHGEHFGEHDLYLHGNSLYQPLIHVPLIVVWPGRLPAGLRVSKPVSLAGLPNTLLELTGGEAMFPRSSWAAGWNGNAGDARQPQTIFAEIATPPGCPPCHGRSPIARGPMRCVREGNFKYIRTGQGEEELFDLGADPHERHNLAESPLYDELLVGFRQAVGADPRFAVRSTQHAAEARHPEGEIRNDSNKGGK